MHVLNCFATRVVKLQYLVLVLVIFRIKDNGQILIKIHSHVKEVQSAMERNEGKISQ